METTAKVLVILTCISLYGASLSSLHDQVHTNLPNLPPKQDVSVYQCSHEGLTKTCVCLCICVCICVAHSHWFGFAQYLSNTMILIQRYSHLSYYATFFPNKANPSTRDHDNKSQAGPGLLICLIEVPVHCGTNYALSCTSGWNTHYTHIAAEVVKQPWTAPPLPPRWLAMLPKWKATTAEII